MPGERFILGNPDTSLEDDTTHFFGASCQDITGRTIPGGNHYVPGPDSCTVCLCDGGKPKWCQAVLCAAPKVRQLVIYYFISHFILQKKSFFFRIASLSELVALVVSLSV